jgi:hypothetical protein
MSAPPAQIGFGVLKIWSPCGKVKNARQKERFRKRLGVNAMSNSRYDNELRILEDQVKYWSDPRIIGFQDISGSRKSAREIVSSLEARIKELRELIASSSK